VTALDIELRDVSADELRDGSDAVSWVLNSWLTSNRDNGMSFGHGAQFNVYWTMHERLAKQLMRGGRVVIATMQGYPDTFCGWACGDSRALHYVYTKQAMRRGRVASRLLEALGSRRFATHAPAPNREWARQWLLRRGCVCSPYALIEGIHSDADFRGVPTEAGVGAGRAAGG
jgi:GNAT superfamily N-acetyltransferase